MSTLEHLEEVRQLLATQDMQGLERLFDELQNDELNRLFARMSEKESLVLLSVLSPSTSADILQMLPFAQATELMDELPVGEAVSIIEEMQSQEQADFVGELHEQQAKAILAELPDEEAAQVRALVGYSDFCAGGLMDVEFVAFHFNTTIRNVVQEMRDNADTYGDYQIQYAYVIDDASRLLGVLRLRDLLLAPANAKLSTIMIRNPLSISDSTELDELREFFSDHAFLGVPVVDANGAMIGVLNRTTVEAALGERATDDYRKTQGLIREELRSMPLLTRSRRRLAWLSINIVLNIVSASVIAIYQETLAQVIALAVFLPIISDMSGCSGNQAVAVSMRELSLGLVEGGDVFKVWMKEIMVGVINGLSLGCLVAAVAWVWQGSWHLGLVVGVALMINTIVAVSIGGTLPLIMRKLRIDPALASGPILTTITDLFGFLTALSLAARFLV